MATILSHPAIPLACGLILGQKYLPWRVILLAMLCSILPDLDVVTFRFGIAYSSPFGHRGFSHSIVMAAVIAALMTLASARLRTRKIVLFSYIFFATISHGILDAFTTGGLGVEFLWPFSEQRYFFPIQFIRVSPIGVANFFGSRAFTVLRSELIFIWLPCLIAVATARIFFHSSPSSLTFTKADHDLTS